jgi:hypothetical protein
MHLYAILTALDPAAASASSISLPTVAISVVVGALSALLTSFTQRWSVKRTLREEGQRRADDAREMKLTALRAYEIALDDAAWSLWSLETHEFSRIEYPKDLNALRIAARPYFSHVESLDPIAFGRMNHPAEDGTSAGLDASEFEDARKEILKVIASIEGEVPTSPKRRLQFKPPAVSVRTEGAK